VDAAPGFPHIADQHAGQQIVDDPGQFKQSVAHHRHNQSADDLIAILCRGGRWIGENEEREIQDRFNIRRPEYLGHRQGIARAAWSSQPATPTVFAAFSGSHLLTGRSGGSTRLRPAYGKARTEAEGLPDYLLLALRSVPIARPCASSRQSEAVLIAGAAIPNSVPGYNSSEDTCRNRTGSF
jgi:hypothetical protein